MHFIVLNRSSMGGSPCWPSPRFLLLVPAPVTRMHQPLVLLLSCFSS